LEIKIWMKDNFKIDLGAIGLNQIRMGSNGGLL
jgi:hypothetical protein